MTVSELKNKIKSGDIGGAYILSGEEDYLKKHYLRELGKIACADEGFALFNRVVFDGADVSVQDIGEAIKAPPMMSEFKLIEWLYPDLDGMSESERKSIEELAASVLDYPYAVLVLLTGMEGFEPGSAKRPSKLAARLSKCYNLINFEKSADVQLVQWLKRHFDTEGILTDSDTLLALIFRSGHSMEVLRGEVLKLAAYAKANKLKKIGKNEVAEVASATLECDAFALSTAITDKNRENAFLALADMKGRRMEAGAVLATLCRAFSELVIVALLLEEGKDANDMEAILKWNAYKIKICISSAKKWGAAKLTEALSRLRSLDAESKSGGASGYKVIEMFVCQYI